MQMLPWCRYIYQTNPELMDKLLETYLQEMHFPVVPRERHEAVLNLLIREEKKEQEVTEELALTLGQVTGITSRFYTFLTHKGYPR